MNVQCSVKLRTKAYFATISCHQGYHEGHNLKFCKCFLWRIEYLNGRKIYIQCFQSHRLHYWRNCKLSLSKDSYKQVQLNGEKWTEAFECTSLLLEVSLILSNYRCFWSKCQLLSQFQLKLSLQDCFSTFLKKAAQRFMHLGHFPLVLL